MVAQVLNVGGKLAIHRGFTVPDDLRAQLRDFNPRTGLGRIVKQAFWHLPTDLAGELLDAITRSVVMQSRLELVHIEASGRRHDLGIVSEKVVTDTGVGFIVDAWQNLVEMEIMKFHGIGTGGTAEAASQTALVTEITTAYATDNTRPTGSLTESAANAFQTVGTITPDATVAATEHGLFSQAATGGGVMFDRSLFTVVNLASGDSLVCTYTVTLTSGG